MKTVWKKDDEAKISLNHLVKHLQAVFQPAAVKHNSLLVNDVPEAFLVHTDKDALAAVIGGLFNNVISKTKDSCIRISASSLDNVILIQIRDNSYHVGDISESGVEYLQTIARRFGGSIHLDQQNEKCSILTLSFLNVDRAA